MSLIPEHRSLIPYTTNERPPAPVPGFGNLGTARWELTEPGVQFYTPRAGTIFRFRRDLFG